MLFEWNKVLFECSKEFLSSSEVLFRCDEELLTMVVI